MTSLPSIGAGRAPVSPERVVRVLFLLPIAHIILLALVPRHANSAHLLRPLGVLGSVGLLFYAARVGQGTRRWTWFFQGLTMTFSAAFTLFRIAGVPLAHPNMQLLSVGVYICSLVGSGLYLQQRSWWVGNRWRVMSGGITVGYASLVMTLACLPLLLPTPLNERSMTTLTYVAYDIGIFFAFGLQGLRHGLRTSPIRFLLPGLFCLLVADMLGVVFATTGMELAWHWPLYTVHSIFLGLTAYRDVVTTTANDAPSIAPLKEWIVWASLPLCLVLGALLTAGILGGVSSAMLIGLVVVALGNEAIALHDYRRITLALHQARVDAVELATTRERNRVARDIHDGLGHYFTGVGTQLAAAQVLLDVNQERARTALGTAQRLTDEGLDEIRRSITALRELPVGTRPLSDALHQLIDTTGLPTSLVQTGTSRQLSTGIELALYRATQEALTNARKHAHATAVEVHLHYDPDVLQLTVRDNGEYALRSCEA